MNVVRSTFPRIAGVILLACVAVAGVRPASAERRGLADSTYVDEWRLPNGLRVVTRDVPGTPGVAITLAIPFGSDQDPEGREGWATLLAHAEFLSAGPDAPERTLADLESSRPLGYRIDIHPRVTRLTELATQRQFPGVLHQMAGRFRAGAPTAKSLAAVRAAVHALLLDNYRKQIPSALHYRVRDAGRAQGNHLSERYAEAKGLDQASVAQVTEALRTRFVPANAVLSLAGDLRATGIDLRRVLENEFGSIPAGTVAAQTPAGPLQPAVRVVEIAGLPYPVGAIGLLAPALSDTLHPSFFMNALVTGAHIASRWGRTPQAPSPFHYSLLDDPTLVRFYPPITQSDLDSMRIREAYQEGLLSVSRSTISFEAFSNLHDGVRWMLGGALTEDLLKRAHNDAGLLATIANTAATRELWGGEPFWSEYRRRFELVDRPAFGPWADYFRSPSHQVQVILLPATEPEATKKR